MFSLPILLLTILSVHSAPVDPSNNEIAEKPKDTYDFSQFDEVHDQRQNGTENWRLNLHKVVLVYAPPKDLITAAMLVGPDLLGDSDFDEFLKPEKPEETTFVKPEKPDEAVKPEKPEELVVQTEVTTKGPEGSTVESSSVAATGGSTGRRILRLPSFLKPFVRRHHTQP